MFGIMNLMKHSHENKTLDHHCLIIVWNLFTFKAQQKLYWWYSRYGVELLDETGCLCLDWK